MNKLLPYALTLGVVIMLLVAPGLARADVTTPCHCPTATVTYLPPVIGEPPVPVEPTATPVPPPTETPVPTEVVIVSLLPETGHDDSSAWLILAFLFLGGFILFVVLFYLGVIGDEYHGFPE